MKTNFLKSLGKKDLIFKNVEQILVLGQTASHFAKARLQTYGNSLKNTTSS